MSPHLLFVCIFGKARECVKYYFVIVWDNTFFLKQMFVYLVMVCVCFFLILNAYFD